MYRTELPDHMYIADTAADASIFAVEARRLDNYDDGIISDDDY